MVPGGQYGQEVIKPYFPPIDPADIESMAASRYSAAASQRSCADTCRVALGQLSGESGLTADDIRQQHLLAIGRHEATAARHEAIAGDYLVIAQTFRTLQAELTEIARTVDLAVGVIRGAPLTLEEKNAAIADVISKASEYARHSATTAQDIIDQLTRNLVKDDGTGLTLPQLYNNQDTAPATSGLDPDQVNFAAEEQPQGSSGLSPQHIPTNGATTLPESAVTPLMNENLGAVSGPLHVPGPVGASTPANVVSAPVATPSGPSLANSIQPSAPSVSSPTPSLVNPIRADAPSLGAPVTSQAQLNQLTSKFADGLVQGMQTPAPSVPVSPVASTQALPMDTQGASAQSTAAPAAHAYATATPTSVSVEQPTPVVAAAPPVAAVAPAAPAGPLPAYGADIRPATPVLASAAAPAVPSVPASAAAPVASAPTSAASGTNLSQPAVVRQAPVVAPPQGGVPIAGEAAFAAATGAIAGELNSEAIEQTRLYRLVECVARQEPGLRWAIGEHSDGTTLLVTDIASGWVPPGVEIPVGVEVLQPERRRGDLLALLGDATLTAAYSPGQYLPAPDASEPINTSTRPLHAPRIDDLGWELGQATNWRDGLPRLAHTLAKAAVAGTGILDAEVDMLHHHLSSIRTDIWSTYPNPAPLAVQNYMLLAAIDALISGDNRAANYHFAWFRAVGVPT